MEILKLNLQKENFGFLIFFYFFRLKFIVIDSSFDLKSTGKIGALTTLYSIFIFIPSLSLSVRILHDDG